MVEKKVLVVGANGDLGRDVVALLESKVGETRSGIASVQGIDVEAGVDLSDEKSTTAFFESLEEQPDVVVDCAAWTDTKAEEETPAGREAGFKLNVLAPRTLARASRTFGFRLVHVSTDEVFSQHCRGSGWLGFFRPGDVELPVSVYGTHKLLGEKAVMEATGGMASILRVSWLVSASSQKSFPAKIVRAATRALAENEKLRLVSDCFSVPTTTLFAAEAIYHHVVENRVGIYHVVPEADEPVSRAAFAEAVLSYFSGEDLGFPGREVQTELVHSQEAWRPKFSCLEGSESLGGWKKWLDDTMVLAKPSILKNLGLGN